MCIIQKSVEHIIIIFRQHLFHLRTHAGVIDLDKI